jgi:hypothetical protein
MTSQDPSRKQDVLGLVDFAGKVLYTGDTLVGAGTVIGGSDPGEKAFAADAPGGFGELCRQLHRQWTSALDARAAEAKEQGERLVGIGEKLGRVAADYAGTDITIATEIARAGSGFDAVRPPARSLTVRPGR